MTTLVPRTNWASALHEFTSRNAGRTTTLEEYDTDFGRQVIEQDYPLRGVTYDRHDHRIEIMVGDLEGTEHHLTRSVGNVLYLDLLKDDRGNDEALRIEREDGRQTVLVLNR